MSAVRTDALALSPVPTPAPDEHPWRDLIVIALFVLALAVPLIGTIPNYRLEVTAFENRRTAPWPYIARNLKELRALPAEFEAAFADRFGGRDKLIAFHHFTKAILFDVSPVPNLMIGRDGWLFFLGEDGKSLDRDYRGILPYSQLEPFQVAAELKRRHDYLASRGIAYVVMIVPDKHTIYPEYLPFWVSRGPGGTRLDLVYAALKAYPEVKVLDIRPALLAAKARERVYFKTDSHWNYLGALVGYDALIAALKPMLPSVPSVPASRPPYDPNTDYYSGDLTKLAGLPEWLDEEDVAPFAKVLGDSSGRCATRSTDPLPPDYPPHDYVVDVCNKPQLPTALVYRDSMGDLLIPLLSENFRRTVYVTDRHLDQALVEREKPDVVIEEMVERLMHAPAALPMS